jgi:hypothetical protein
MAILNPDQQALMGDHIREREQLRQTLEEMGAERGFGHGHGPGDCDG